MDEKCNKIEGLFTFSSEEDLLNHINECEDCKKEYETQQKVSELIDEVKFYYHSKKRKRNFRIKAACAAIFILVSTFSLGLAVWNNEDLTETLMYGNTLSAEELGFPVDSYGLLMVDE